MFDLRLLANTGEQEMEENIQGDNSYIGHIDKEFGPLIEGEEPVEETDNRPPTKKAKLHHSASTLSKELNHSRDEASAQLKITKKKGAGLKLVSQIKEWRKHREKEYEQRELAKLSSEVQVMQSIQKHYAEEG